MPYKKKSQKKMSTLDKASKALDIALKLKRLTNVEIKTKDFINNSAISDTGQVVRLDVVDQGDTDSTRDGDSLKPLNLTQYLHMKTNSVQSAMIRCIIFRGKQENGASFTVAQVLETATIGSHKDHDLRFRSKILSDKVYSVMPPTTGANGVKVVRQNSKLFGHIQYEATTTAVNNGGIYMLLISDQTGVNAPTVGWNHRLSWCDN